jgi:hypothetical protein
VNREQLEEIRARALAATPGPWLREWAFNTHFVVPLAAHDVAAGNVSRLKPRQRADAEFIAHARTDVSALLDEIDRLSTALGACQASLRHHLDVCTDAAAKNNLPLHELLLMHDWDELVFGGFICLSCTPDDAAIEEENVYWPCPPLRAAGLTDEAAKEIILRHRAMVEARARGEATLRAAATTAEGSAEGGTSKGSEVTP